MKKLSFNFLTQTSYTFDGQKDDENVQIFLRRHWIIIILRLVGLAFFILFPIIPLLALSGVITTYHLESIALFILILFYIILWSIAFFHITMYLLDTWIVTEDRILDMTQHGFFARTVSEMSLSKVQDISVKVEGLLPTIFSYGNIEIQSAGTVDKFICFQVPHPNQVKEDIMALVRKARLKEEKEARL